jgi:hypothetical protein
VPVSEGVRGGPTHRGQATLQGPIRRPAEDNVPNKEVGTFSMRGTPGQVGTEIEDGDALAFSNARTVLAAGLAGTGT